MNDGVWKKYRLTLVEPEKNLDRTNRQPAQHRFRQVRAHAVRRGEGARLGAGTVYESGVHVISLEAEGDTSIRLWIDAEVAVDSVQSSTFIPGVELKPVVTDAKLKFDDFRLTRISDVRGPVAHELGDLLKDMLKKELAGPKLVAKLNRSLTKHPERLRLSPDTLLGKASPKKQSIKRRIVARSNTSEAQSRRRRSA